MTNPDQKQAPGIYRRRIGDAMVTVINDGYLDMPFELLRGVPLGNMHSLMREVFHEGPPRITVNAARRRNRTRYSPVYCGWTTSVSRHHPKQARSATCRPC